MCVLYVRFGSKVMPRTFGCVAMRSAVLFIFRSRLLLYFAGSGVNGAQVVLSGFSVRLFVLSRKKLYVCMVVCISLLYKCVYVYCVEIFAHVECYSDCSRRGSHLVKPLFYGVVYCV